MSTAVHAACTRQYRGAGVMTRNPCHAQLLLRAGAKEGTGDPRVQLHVAWHWCVRGEVNG